MSASSPTLHLFDPRSGVFGSLPADQPVGGEGLVLVSDDPGFSLATDSLARLGDFAALRSCMLGTVWSCDLEVERIAYPRKDEVCFPARSVLAVAFDSRLLRRAPVLRASRHSAALTMLTLLSLDVVFPLIEQIEVAPEHRRIAQDRYVQALDELAQANMEIHGFRTASVPPYQDLWIQMKAAR